jgi:hypothetical protein
MMGAWIGKFRRSKTETVMGHRIAEPRPTLWAVFWVLMYLVLPVLAVGMLIDALVQLATGHCVGLWCLL